MAGQQPNFFFSCFMNKILPVIMAMAVLGTGGWYGFQRYQAIQTQRTQKAQVAAVEAKQRAAQAAADATRREVEPQLKLMKVTSIMPGQPGIVIIDKKEYTEGENLALPKGGKRVQIIKVQDSGVLLAYNGLSFRLEPPAAPDLAALRKGR